MKKSIDGKYLKKLRTEAGITQAKLANRIKISRETVINIENNHPGSIESIELPLIRDWKDACKHAPSSVVEEFVDHLKKFLKIS